MSIRERDIKKAFVLAAVFLAGCDGGTAESADNSSDGPVSIDSTSKTTAENAVAACVERAVLYFKEIGSYPTLQSEPNTGRAAEEVAQERCQRTTTAF